MRDLYVGESDLSSHLVSIALVFRWQEFQKVHLLRFDPFSFVKLSLRVDPQLYLLGKANLNDVINLFVCIKVEVTVVDVVNANVDLVPQWRNELCNCPAIQVSGFVELENLFFELSIVCAIDLSKSILVLHFVINTIGQDFSLLAHLRPNLLMECVIVNLVKFALSKLGLIIYNCWFLRVLRLLWLSHPLLWVTLA